MTTDNELAAYALALEKRVDRLKTLEEPSPAVAGSWTFIDSIELAGIEAEIEFENIPQLYDDLVVIWRARSNKAGAPGFDFMIAQFNDDVTLGNYDTVTESANSPGTCYQDSGYVALDWVLSAAATGDADDFSHGICYIPEYTGIVYKKTTQSFTGTYGFTATFGINGQCNGCWSETPEAITKIRFYLSSASSFLADTLIELYGLTR